MDQRPKCKRENLEGNTGEKSFITLDFAIISQIYTKGTGNKRKNRYIGLTKI